MSSKKEQRELLEKLLRAKDHTDMGYEETDVLEKDQDKK
jgi:hypothetical protein